MKVKLSLFMTIIVLCGTINAQTIQERLEKALQETEVQRDLITKEYFSLKDFISDRIEQVGVERVISEKLYQKKDKLYMKMAQLESRSSGLYSILYCMKSYFDQPRKQRTEQEIAYKCFDKVAAFYKKEVKSSQKYYKERIEKDKDNLSAFQKERIINKLKKMERVEKELERIRKKDLRQSWFWWLW
jgi:hypothetical protein